MQLQKHLYYNNNITYYIDYANIIFYYYYWLFINEVFSKYSAVSTSDMSVNISSSILFLLLWIITLFMKSITSWLVLSCSTSF